MNKQQQQQQHEAADDASDGDDDGDDGIIQKLQVAARHGGAAAGATVCATVVAQPWDTMKVYMQTHRGMTLRASLREFVVEKGPASLWRGFLPMVSAMAQKAVAFAAYEHGVRTLDQRRGRDENGVQRLSHHYVGGMLGGLCNFPLVCAVDQTKIAMQIRARGDAASTLGTIRRLYRGYGVMGFLGAWRGSLVRQIPGYALYFGNYQWLKRRFRNDAPDAWIGTFFQDMAFGAASGTFMWQLYYPVNMNDMLLLESPQLSSSSFVLLFAICAH
jgi:solute carrier family 25 carnitine/acylcarnitine transporter 20/29